MSSPPPTKPPRGVKQGKETSGLLMSVIRTLSASETNEQREKERAKLEKEYKKSDARLDELVAAHAQEITDVMQKFSSVSTALSAWGQHCSAAEARLAACRALLRVRRDDLRRLWADARTHHHALRMLTDIERVVVCEREARELTAAGRVVGAAHALRAALMTARTELPAVTALNATTDHLEAKKQELVDVIVGRLSDAVYRDERAPLNRRLSARRRTALLLAELTKSEEVTDSYLQDITPEYEASLTEDDKTFETTVMISLEALGVLEQLREATEKFKVQIQNELLEVIDSVSRRIIEEGDVEEGEEDGEIQEAGGESETGRPLTRLIHCLTEEFEAGGTRNRRLLQLWRAALIKHKISEQSLHTEQHYWSAVQQVMQLLLTEYLEIESVALSSQRAPEPVTELKLSDYFSKKKPQRRREKLFKLMTPPPPSARGRRHRYPLVCTPQPALLHAALPALHALCALIEKPGAGECSLRMFVSDYVKWCETERLSREARAAVEAAVKAPGAWRERVMVPGRESERPVLSCCVEAWSVVRACALSARRCGSLGGVWAARATIVILATIVTLDHCFVFRFASSASTTSARRSARRPWGPAGGGPGAQAPVTARRPEAPPASRTDCSASTNTRPAY
nr:exocyst complex component 4 [Danaus plexippus plexippus]